MSDPEVVALVQRKLKQGKSRYRIKRVLKEQALTDDKIDAIFREAEALAAPTRTGTVVSGVNCHNCNKAIKDTNDMNVVAFFGISPRVFCNDCYSSRERGILRHTLYFPQKFPINSALFKIGLFVSTVVILFLAYAILGDSGVWTQNGKAAAGEISNEVKLLISGFLLLSLGWAWVLHLYTSGKISQVKRYSLVFSKTSLAH
ncbi:MAG: hypothetical protein JXB14_02500 [Candidatus Altiarchaeota archaeon]|nr:hypothetical protein [Candidatus Altiarchaeota archaeon]